MSLRLVGVPGGIGCGLAGGVVAEADSDRLVVAALFGVDKVGYAPPGTSPGRSGPLRGQCG